MISRFEYSDREDGWTLGPFDLREINLLVGISGVGKSRILRAFQDVQRAALRGADGIAPASWALDFGEPARGEAYRWRAETSVRTIYPLLRTRENGGRSDARFDSEMIDSGSERLVMRRPERFVFRDKVLPKLDPAESAIRLLAAEDRIRPLHENLNLWLFMLPSFLHGFAISDVASAEASRRKYPDIESLGGSELTTAQKLYVLQRDHRNVFDEIVHALASVFPEVEDVSVSTFSELGYRLVPPDSAQLLTIALRERGVEAWIPEMNISTGMLKTLEIITELIIAPVGTVVFIDEIENSLGVNCLGEVTRILRRHAGRVQSVITSHHPYVINNIPFEYWKLVRRVDSRVSVIDATEIPSLQTASPIEKFTQLINAPEYEAGVA